MSSSTPIIRGTLLAVVAAVLFGATTPFVKLLSANAGAFPTAMLLYAGASLAATRVTRARSADETPVRREHARRLFVVALFGAVIAPVLLAWGLRSTSGAAASLLLNFEALFTVLLAARLHREPLGLRVVLALAFMFVGGALLVVPGWRGDLGIGAVAVTGAALCWATDNTLTRPLADLDPVSVTKWKGTIGATLSFAVALLTRATWPPLTQSLALLCCGAIGYGVSLRFYLRAQRLVGAGRTGSVFGLAPFIGVVVAFGLGDRSAEALPTIAAAVAFACGVMLHGTEKHAHVHYHEASEHEHVHRHDDGHHDHVHDPPVIGEHSHRHRHDARTHEHPHAADVHHQHH